MMTKKIILLLSFIFHIFTTHHCTAMEAEKDNKIILLNNGLLTIIPGILSSTGYRGHWLSLTDNRIIYETSEKKDSLINLLYYKKQLTHDKGANDYQLFCPLTIKTSNGLMENLGQFDKKVHHEAIEAIRCGKAIYYAQEQGALIYSLDEQPNPIICKALNGILENAKKQNIKV
jgi:hypothetical protein